MGHSSRVEMWMELDGGMKFEIHAIGPDRGTFHEHVDEKLVPTVTYEAFTPTIGTLRIFIDGTESTHKKVVFWTCLRGYEKHSPDFQYVDADSFLSQMRIEFERGLPASLVHVANMLEKLLAQTSEKHFIIGSAAFQRFSDGWAWGNAVTNEFDAARFPNLLTCVLARIPDQKTLETPTPYPDGYEKALTNGEAES